MKTRVQSAAVMVPLLALGLVMTVWQAPAGSAANVAKAASAAAPGFSTEPEDPAFYVRPNPLPAGNPGDIIRSKPSKAGAATDKINAWQVMYLSSDALGGRIAVTGTILTPKGVDPKTTPVVSFGVGTHGPAFKCTPSYMSEIGALYEQPAVNDFIAAGYSVALTDYEGYGPNPSKTTYITGRSEGHVILDIVRAGQRLPAVAWAADAKVVLRGYSQGGGASLWGAQLQPTYAPEINLVGVAAGGVPADLVQVSLSLDGKKGSGFLFYSLIGLDHAYPELRLVDYLNDAGKKLFSDLENGACTVGLLTTYANKKLVDFTTTSPVLTPPWLARVAENKLGTKKINVPVFQYLATNDDIVAPAQGRALRSALCANGTSVQFNELPVGDHITLVYSGNKDSLAFIKDRMAGKPATPNCA